MTTFKKITGIIKLIMDVPFPLASSKDLINFLILKSSIFFSVSSSDDMVVGSNVECQIDLFFSRYTRIKCVTRVDRGSFAVLNV